MRCADDDFVERRCKRRRQNRFNGGFPFSRDKCALSYPFIGIIAGCDYFAAFLFFIIFFPFTALYAVKPIKDGFKRRELFEKKVAKK